jgi:hypothetical protein
MAHRLRPWLIELLEWVQTVEADLASLADQIIDEFERGGAATTPPDGGT